MFDRFRAARRRPLPQPQAATYDQQALAALLGLVQPTTRVPVTETTVLGLPGAWRAVQMIANAVALSSPLTTFAADGVTAVPSPPIVDRPLVGMGQFDYWHMATASAVLHGNFVGLLADYEDGLANQAVPIPVQAWHCYRDRAGYLVHQIAGDNYSSEQVVHVRLFTLPGQDRGLGAVEVFRRNLGAQLDQAVSVANSTRTGMPPGIVTTDAIAVPTQEQRDDFDASWEGRYGVTGRTIPALFGSSMKWTPLAFSPKDAELLSSRQFSIAELAFMFNLDPSDLAAAIGGQSQTYANIEQRAIERTTSSYSPLMRRFAEAWTDLIPAGNHVRFDPDELQRTDTKTRYEGYEIGLRNKWLTVLEVRTAERKPPLPATPTTPTEEAPTNDNAS